MKPRRGITRSKGRIEERKKEAEQRNKKWSSLSATQQLAELDNRLGTDQGAKKQRRKLQERIEKESKISKRKGEKDERK